MKSIKTTLLNESDLVNAMLELNPFWSDKTWGELPVARRFPFYDAIRSLQTFGSQRAIFLKGLRGIGKSTILKQTAQWLKTEQNVSARNIVYLNFEKRPLRQLPWANWFLIWERHFKPTEGPIYLLLDEIQYTEGWVEEVRSLLTDSRYRIVVTGSAAADLQSALDSEVRRWVSLRVSPLLFPEYLQLFRPDDYARLENTSIKDLQPVGKTPLDTALISRTFDMMEPAFRDYVLRGGFPEAARSSLPLAGLQEFLSDDLDKALYQDMRMHFSRHDIENLERLFEYVCRHPGLLLDKSKIAESFEVSRPTTARYVKALENGDFLLALRNENSEGKKALKAKPKLYPADVSLRNAILGRTQTVLHEADEWGPIMETLIATHLDVYARTQSARLGYWRRKDTEEIDFCLQKPDGACWLIESKTGGSQPKFMRALQQWSVEKRQRVEACFLISRYKIDSAPAMSAAQWPLTCPLQTIPVPVFLYLLGRESWAQH